MILEGVILVLTTTLFLVSFVNVLYYPVLEKYKIQKNSKKVSLLVPCRNEEQNIESIIISLVNQTYKNTEIIIYNDNSTDSTASILKKLEKKYNIKVLEGTKLPKGWLGKNYACHQLSKKATGDYYCFIDADVQLQKDAIARLMSVHKGGLLSVFPKQIKKSVGEWLVVPLLNWLALSVLPFFTITKVKDARLIAANGQFMCFSKKTYKKIGGHQSVASEIVEDIALGKRTKQQGELVQVLCSQSSISCRMYTTFQEAIRGFSKNFYKGFGVSKIAFSLILAVFSLGLLGPFFIANTSIGLLSIALLIANRVCLSIIEKEPQSIILFPLHNTIFIALGIISMSTKRKQWKNRTILQH